MTCRTNLAIVVKIVDLDTSRICSRNHVVGLDKISFNVKKSKYHHQKRKATKESHEKIGWLITAWKN
jgi:hypothetical protein